MADVDRDAEDAAETAGTEYLDLDGDGVPDAVLTTETVEYDVVGGPDIVETVQELDSGIGDDGRPQAIELSDTVTVDRDRDGTPDEVEVTALTLEADAERNDEA